MKFITFASLLLVSGSAVAALIPSERHYVFTGEQARDMEPWPNKTIDYFYDDSMASKDDLKVRIEDAIDYYEKNTSLKFVEVNTQLKTDLRIKLIPEGEDGINRATIGYNYDTPALVPRVMHLRDGVDVGVIMHELFHVAGFRHEHQRPDRDSHIDFDLDQIQADGSYKSSNYGKKSSSRTIGAYDHASISHYRSAYFGEKIDPERTEAVLAEVQPYARAFRLNFEDFTPENIFDNPSLHIQDLHNGTPLGALDFKFEDVPSSWHSALWDFVPTDTPNVYKIVSYWGDHNSLHVADAPFSPMPIKSDSSSFSLADATWEVIRDGNVFRIKNVSSGRYLTVGMGTLLYTDVESESRFLLQEVMTRGQYSDQELTPSDKLALSVHYNDFVRIQVADNTDSIADNKSLRMSHSDPYGDPMLEVLPIIDGNNQYWSAMWAMERKGSYFMIKNRWTNEYLNTENANFSQATEIRMDPAGTENHLGADISQWYSAQWELVIDDDSFKVRNRWTGRWLNVVSDSLVTEPSTFQNSVRWDFSRVDDEVYDWPVAN
ncbi:M12 family metallopeptidase [Marinagarivorans cellulosilyticus]|uniref:Peptidase M12A domain-containing protein n=1 Tax=Marinagarivorans cellulosilyticus TaxID=2721545 RepID=A0AAN1WLL6_9GAMM|nr:M12 family metallopeptidase [Marinagarivorans cellulosilyticus]BCD99868.1 hypothetical protein MARGE09_P4070 [Marinagarivorans cellulosilyticus]